MKLTTLGRTGMPVSRYCLGTMALGAQSPPAESVRVVHAALDAGINFIDTADAYDQGRCEEVLGRALTGRRDHVILATKVHFPMHDEPGSGGNSRRWITRAVEGSLRRLGTDHLDLYQIHRPDPATDIEETLSVLSDLVRAGKVRAIGTSTFPAEQIVEAQWVAQDRGHVRLGCEQPAYSLLARGAETAVLPTAQRFGMGVIGWSPLAGGFLTGRYRRDRPIDLTTGRAARYPQRFDPARPENGRKLDAVEELIGVAESIDCSLTHLAMAFVVAHPALTAAIIGPRTLGQLQDLLAGADLVLDDETLDRIDAIVAPGTTINPADAGSQLPESLTDPSLRRRPREWRRAR